MANLVAQIVIFLYLYFSWQPSPKAARTKLTSRVLPMRIFFVHNIFCGWCMCLREVFFRVLECDDWCSGSRERQKKYFALGRKMLLHSELIIWVLELPSSTSPPSKQTNFLKPSSNHSEPPFVGEWRAFVRKYSVFHQSRKMKRGQKMFYPPFFLTREWK